MRARFRSNETNLRLVIGRFSRKIISSSKNPVMASIRPSKFRFALVASLFNREYTDALLAAAQLALKGHEMKVVRVPGAFEIPLQAQRLARTKRYEAVLALGVVWQGKTLHAQEILRAVTDALMKISLETDVPVIHEVLAVGSEAEARARCMGVKLNRGREAAQAALALALSDRAKGSN
jgi:6,7-dimethyl-8-ribityllumazine synthase